MSQANELLSALTAGGSSAVEGHIVIGTDRFITVPDELKKIAVQYDHNIETVTFDCPRYWDEHDLSAMRVYINYMRPDGSLGMSLCENIVVEDDIFHFDWTISGHVTEFKGTVTFLVCIKTVDDENIETNHWNSELNSDLYISEGLKCQETVLRRHPDIIAQLLTMLENTVGYMNSTKEYYDAAVLQAEAIEAAAERVAEDESYIRGIAENLEPTIEKAVDAVLDEAIDVKLKETNQTVSTNTENISTNAKNIETNAKNIETNAKNIETNADAITALEMGKTTDTANKVTVIGDNIVETWDDGSTRTTTIDGNTITTVLKNGDETITKVTTINGNVITDSITR